MSVNRFYNSNTISDDVYELLKKEILNLTIKPGQVLTEQEICEQYQISRTPSRDVLQRLKNDGLIISIPYKANYVSLLDFDKIKQLIYMRLVLEVQVIKDVIELDSEAFIHALENNLKRQEYLLASDFEVEAFYEIDSEFHRIWFEEAKKLAVWEMIQKSQINYTRFRMLDIVMVKNFKAIFEEHIKLVHLIKAKDIEGIEKHLERHFNGGISRLGDQIYSEYAEYFM
ncbi:GntR family transcriptional regulator [Fusibacter sp. 3D3]|uniref:GntR family transcriptional regulator n=1 Tax=Fusibacter sp. 3D3 TaxID=1048380 RepID=UPI0008539FA6|nr:GntR family transcriptional regulator [Fusibacter sp. 3D3]GAU75703.1 transcriptional regulator [Fusibacter sp. 3D3]